MDARRLLLFNRPPFWLRDLKSGELLAFYKKDIADGRLLAYKPLGSTTPQVKGSLFSVAVPEDVPYTGLLTTDVITTPHGTVTDGVEKVPGTSSVLMRKADWTVTGEDATHIASDVAGGVRYQSDTTSPQLNVSHAGVLVVGGTYRVTISGLTTTSGELKSDSFGLAKIGRAHV